MTVHVTEQMTTGKGKLRFQIRELEMEVERLRNSPEAVDLRAQATKLQSEKDALSIELGQRVQELTRLLDAANAMITAARNALKV